ncbi:MAG: hypothetical protein QXO22_08105 [Thermosphaera sp.]
MTKRYIIYDRQKETARVGDKNDVKEEILRYITSYIDYWLDEVRMNLNEISLNLANEIVAINDVEVLEKQKQLIDKVQSAIISYSYVRSASNFEQVIDEASRILAVSTADDIIDDEIELLTNHERPETAELLKKCKNTRWIGFGIDDEYGTIICEVIEQ